MSNEGQSEYIQSLLNKESGLMIEVDKIQAENKRLRAALKLYGTHLSGCGVRWTLESPRCLPCDCDYLQALKGVKP